MKRLHCLIVFLLLTFVCHLSASPVLAQPKAWPTINPGCVSNTDVATLKGLECLFTNIVRVLTPIAGIALFIMLIVGSFQMLTAGGDPKQIQKARSTLTAAIFGFVLFFGIWFILLLIREITGVDVTKFEIPGP